MELDLPGVQPGVDVPAAQAHLALDLEHPLLAHPLCHLVHPGRAGIEDHLDDAAAVAEVDEGEAAVVAILVDPAVDGDVPAGVGGARLAAGGALGRHQAAFPRSAP